MCSARSIFALLLLIASAGAGEPRVDLEGEPLPPGVLARFGTSRLRHPGIHGEDNGFAFRPDSKALASFDGQTIRLWDLINGKMLWKFDTQQAFAHAAFSPDGKHMVLCCHRPLILDTATGKVERELKTTPKHAAAFSPDGTTIATARFDWGESVELWNIATGERIAELPTEKTGKPQELAFTSDGKTLRAAMSGTRAGSAIVTIASWDVATRKRGTDFDPNVRLAIYRMSEDGRLLGTRESHIEELQIWDIATAKSVGEVSLAREHFNFAPDSKTLVTFVANRTDRTTIIAFWDTATCKKIREIRIPRQLGEEARLSPDGKLVATSKRGQTLCIWDAQTGRRLLDSNGHSEQVTRLEFANDDKILVSAGGGEIRTWDAATSRMLKVLPGRLISMLPGGREMLVGQREMCRVEVATGTVIGEPFAKPTLAGMKDGASFRLYRAIVTAEGRGLFARGYVDEPDAKIPKTYVVTWDLLTGKVLAESTTPGDLGIETQSSDGRTVITNETTSHPNTATNKNYYPTVSSTDMHPLDLFSGRKLATVHLPEEYRYHALLSGDGQTLATVTGQSGAAPALPPANLDVRLWELRTGLERLRIPLKLPTHYDPHMLEFSPGGRMMAISRSPNQIEVYETATGRELVELRGFESTCYTLTFRTDGRRLVSGHMDGSILLWELPELTNTPLDAAAIDTAWKDLASEDGALANKASWALASTPASVKLFAARLKPANDEIAEKMKACIALLDSKSFHAREKASLELAALLDQADPSVLKSVAGKLTDEQAARMKRILDTPASRPAPELLRSLRAIETLERMGTQDAADVLRVLAKGPAETRMTHEAKDALCRLMTRILTEK